MNTPDELRTLRADCKNLKAEVDLLRLRNVTWHNDYNKLKELLRSLVTDVEEMRVGKGDHYFGGFSHWHEDDNFMANIEWPNLSILIDKAKEILK